MTGTRMVGSWVALVVLAAVGRGADNQPPAGFKALFNGKDLSGWKGLVANPKERAKMSAAELAEAQKKADQSMREHWKVVDGVLVFDGKGESLCTDKDYGDFELLVDWKILAKGDSGIYLRGSPQVQIWDPVLFNIGSGGLYNNQKNPSKPSADADKPIGEWNTFRIKMVGDKVSVELNGKLVVDNVTMENYWERDKPIYPKGQIELQNHGNTLYFKNIYLRELWPHAKGWHRTFPTLIGRPRVWPAPSRGPGDPALFSVNGQARPRPLAGAPLGLDFGSLLALAQGPRE